MNAAASEKVYAFGRFTLDLGRGFLLSEGNVIPLRRQSFALLRLFVENAGRLLDRNMINQTISPSVVVSDDGIAQCVRDLRRALRDEGQTKIKTVFRRGYIFTPEVDQPQRYAKQ
jgi:DNA-binding winged helix-turn-helix (wHTH) protein